MKIPTFIKLNENWNAEPNDPGERVAVGSRTVELTFFLNPWAYAAEEGEVGHLAFREVRKWRLGPTNDEGWYRGQCRYSGIAPEWGEFYEIVGEDTRADQPTDWHVVGDRDAGKRHFLFYLRDNTFEVIASDWQFSR